MYEAMSYRVTERITDGVAVGAVTSYWWMQLITDFFSALLPILGCVWILYQIYTHWNRKKDKQ